MSFLRLFQSLVSALSSTSGVVGVCLLLLSSILPDVHVGSVSAFTNGTLLPSYLCGPLTDGYPKTLGGVLPFFKLATNPFLVPVNNGATNVPPNGNLDMAFGGQVNHTQLLLANFHNKNSIVPFKKVIHTTVVAVASTTNPKPVPGQIVPGAVHVLQLQTTPNDLGVFDDNTALDGAFMYAMDVNISQRVGSFVAFGPNMQAWAACGPNNVGVVHNQLLSCVGHYDGLMWQAPANLIAGHVIDFRGAAVTDNGYGAHTSMYPVVIPAAVATAPAQPPQPCIPTKVLLMAQTQAMLFFANGSPAGAVTSVQLTTSMFTTMAAAAGGAAVLGAPTTVPLATPALATQTSTCTASPCTTNLVTLFKQAGTQNGVLLMSLVAMGPGGSSTVSIPAIVAVGAAAGTAAAAATARLVITSSGTDAANGIMSMCDSTTAYASFGMTLNADADGSCAWYTAYTSMLVATNVAQTNAASTSDSTQMIIIIVASVGGGVLLLGLLVSIWWCSKKKAGTSATQQQIGRVTSL